jgi:hypothetical protein
MECADAVIPGNHLDFIFTDYQQIADIMHVIQVMIWVCLGRTVMYPFTVNQNSVKAVRRDPQNRRAGFFQFKFFPEQYGLIIIKPIVLNTPDPLRHPFFFHKTPFCCSMGKRENTKEVKTKQAALSFSSLLPA